MNNNAQTPPGKSGLASAWLRLRGQPRSQPEVGDLPRIPVPIKALQTLSGPESFRENLLAQIRLAQRRILISALYLQDDDGGREILSALYAAKTDRPQLEISIFVDWHRAQRGLIGKTRSPGNATLYKEMAQRLGPGVKVLGVPVQGREFLGVMHLKGFVIDNKVLYSGASLNDVYLQRHQRYRLDRYHLIENQALADSMAGLLTDILASSAAVHPLDTENAPKTAEIRPAIIRFRRALAKARYEFEAGRIGDGEVGITPLLGIGTRDNELNRTIVQLIQSAQNNLVLLTPYFNLPGPIRRAVDGRIKAGCHVSIVLGDKSANDFYIAPDEPFKAIGALPYLYEANLRRFCKAHHKAITAGRLNVHLWRHDDNTFHLKGMLVDDDYTLLTGSNLNPRAWRLDLENGLLIHDPHHLMPAQNRDELERILAHTQRLATHLALDDVSTYPPPVQRLIKRLARVRADRLVNQML